MAVTLWELLERIEKILLTSAEIQDRGTAEIEARRIVEEAFRRRVGRPLDALQLRLDAGRIQVDSSIVEQAERWSVARRDGALLQHLLGHWTFLDHEYRVTPDVLVPRPETEVLVAGLIDALAAGPAPELGAEIGVGSGIISIELLARFSSLKMVASDVSPRAIELARLNAREVLGADSAPRLTVVRVDGKGSPVGELVKAAGAAGFESGSLDFLVSNPPYLDPTRAAEEVDPDVLRNEPHVALFGPAEDVLHFYRDMAGGAAYLLKPTGFVAVEIPHERAGEILALFEEGGWSARLVADLTGRNRVLLAHRD